MKIYSQNLGIKRLDKLRPNSAKLELRFLFAWWLLFFLGYFLLSLQCRHLILKKRKENKQTSKQRKNAHKQGILEWCFTVSQYITSNMQLAYLQYVVPFFSCVKKVLF